MNLLCAAFIAFWPILSSCQPNQPSLLKSAETNLKNGATISSVLTNEQYLSLHPETEFRELIKKYCAAQPVKIATDDEPGRKIKVLATLQREDQKPVADAVVYFYQTDAKGWYAADKPHVGGNSGDQGHARLFGYAKTDANGRFEIHTIKPSGYPQSDLPAHIHVEVHDLEGYRSLVTEFLFDDDERMQGSIRANAERNGYLIAKPGKTNPPPEQQFSYTLVLQRE